MAASRNVVWWNLLLLAAACSGCGPSLQSERRAMPKLQAEPTTRVTERDDEKHLRSSFSIAGTHLTLLAAPSRDSERIVVVVRPLRTAAVPCGEAAMWVEGNPLVLEGTREERNDRGHEILFTLPRQDLKGVGNATRVVLRTCGKELIFDDAAKKALDLFEIQFREQLTLLSTSSPEA